jgi:hypothetical protein
MEPRLKFMTRHKQSMIWRSLSRLRQQNDSNWTRSIRKQHDLFKKMDFASTNLDEQVGFQATLESAERHFEKFHLHLIFNIVEHDRDIRENILQEVGTVTSSNGMPCLKWKTSPQATNGTVLIKLKLRSPSSQVPNPLQPSWAK